VGGRCLTGGRSEIHGHLTLRNKEKRRRAVPKGGRGEEVLSLTQQKETVSESYGGVPNRESSLTRENLVKEKGENVVSNPPPKGTALTSTKSTNTGVAGK